MDLPLDGTQLHCSRRPGQVGRQQNGSPKESQGEQAQHDPLTTLGSIASQVVQNPVHSISTAVHLAFHPTEALYAAYCALTNDEKLARRTRLLQQLCNASTWSEYSAACAELDQIESADEWKEVDYSDLYDVCCLRGRLKRLTAACDKDDVAEMVHLVRCELTRDLGGICNSALHRHSRMGTKFLIDHYHRVVRQVLNRIVNACALGDRRLENIDVRRELEQTRKSYGRTALLLSGGGTLGMSHIGVIKALYEANALPRVISGSSSGSIVAAVLGATPDEELLLKLREFCEGDLAVFVGPHEKSGWGARARHFGKNGYLFNIGNMRRVMADLLGNMTFKEAYNLTRRILNITVSNCSSYESQQVLNYATSGNVVIWSAVVASCAVPFGFEPERLLYKNEETGQLLPWDPQTRYVDGSINGDLPTNILSAEFNVNHSIVSQVNPHVTPFLGKDITSEGEERTPRWISAAGLVREEAIRSMEVLAGLAFLERNNNALSKLNSVLTQRYSGDITLVPVDAVAQFWTIMKNPTPNSLHQSAQRGERATWPVLDMIRTHMNIELLIDQSFRKVQEHVTFNSSAGVLRRMQLKQSKTPKHASSGRIRNRRPARSISATRERKDRHVDQRRMRVTVPDLSPDYAVKVAGEPISPSSNSSRESLVTESEEEDEGTSKSLKLRPAGNTPDSISLPEVQFLSVQSQPNTPDMERGGFFGTPRSGSPARPPMSLLMTPVTPVPGRPTSPDTRRPYRSRLNSSPRPAKSPPPPLRRPSATDNTTLSWHKKLSKPLKKVSSRTSISGRTRN